MADSLPRISVVIPTYNMGRFLPQCLESIRKQDYPDVEVVLVDGMSTDNTPELAAHYSDLVKQYIREPDSGQPDAVTKGLQRATGEIHHWHAADDIVLPGAFHRVARELSESTDLVFSDGIAFSGPPLIQRSPWYRWENFLDAVLFFGRFQSDSAYWNARITPKGLPLDSSKDLTCDEDFFLRMWVGSNYRWIPQPLGAFRMHGDQVSRRVDRSHREQTRADTRRKIFAELGWSAQEVERRRRNRRLGYRLRRALVKGYSGVRYILRKLTGDYRRRRYSRWFFEEWLEPPIDSAPAAEGRQSADSSPLQTESRGTKC